VTAMQFAPVQGWAPPPPAVVFGDLHADGSRIILIPQGDGWDMKTVGERLSAMTPAKTVEDKTAGIISMPATWVSVTQLSHAFPGTYGTPRWVPGPRLCEWIVAELTRRTSTHSPLITEFPDGQVLRPYQEAGARMIAAAGRFLLCDEPGPQPVTTPIWTPDGWTELGRLQPGDIVYDLHGRQVPVRAVKFQGHQPVYRVTFSDGASTLATGEHRWRVWTKNDRSSRDARLCRDGYRFKHGRVLSTEQMRSAGLKAIDGSAAFFLPQQPVLQDRDDNAELPLDPYAYGALLGDGGLTHPGQLVIVGIDDYILSRVEQAAIALGTTFRRYAKTASNCMRTQFHQKGKLRAVLEDLGACKLANAKAIDPRYLAAGEHARRELLAGLLDTDGHVISHGSAAGFATCSAQLAIDVSWLARSLGAAVTESAPRGIWSPHSRLRVQDQYAIRARFPADGPNPFRVPRKADAWASRAAKNRNRLPSRAFRAIKPAGAADVCCIELDTDDDLSRVYLTDTTLIPTHNTGKTCTTIAGLAEIQARGGDIFPMVIVVPSWSVADVWVREISTWMPSWTVKLYGGPKRSELLEGLTSDIYVSTYATARLDANDASGPLVKLNPAAVVLDEAHLIKSARLTTEKGTSTVSAAARRIAAHATTVTGLTGTPVTKNTGDIFTALSAMDPGSWPSRDRFIRRYCETQPGEYEETVTGLKMLAAPEFFACLTGAMRRVAKADVLDQLPPKVYSVRRVKLPDDWRRAYDDLERDMLAELPGGQEISVMETLTQLTLLTQLASCAADVEITEETDEETGLVKKRYHAVLRAPSWKADELLEILAERKGQPVAVFAPSRQLIEVAGRACVRAGFRTGYITGTTAQSARAQAITDFQGGKLDVILATTGAGGTGITLTAAGTVVFLQRPWSLAESLQAEDRAHRWGSEIHECIEVIDIVAADTVDARVRDALKNKSGMLSEVVRDPRVVRELLGGLK
jgi:superfamily II DNA or RNA helicase